MTEFSTSFDAKIVYTHSNTYSYT